MHFNSPHRPRSPAGALIRNTKFILPFPQIRATSEPEWVLIFFWLPIGPNEYKEHVKMTSYSQVALVIREYFENPEQTLEKFFGWSPPVQPVRSTGWSTKLSLDDLEF